MTIPRAGQDGVGRVDELECLIEIFQGGARIAAAIPAAGLVDAAHQSYAVVRH
jgi:hypothetical protein